MSFGLVTYLAPDGNPQVGVLLDDYILDTAPTLRPLLGNDATMQGVLDLWDQVLPRLTELAGRGVTNRALPLSAVRLLAPLSRPVNLYCAFANYVDHMQEMGGQPADKSVEDPYVFMVPSNTVIGPGEPIVLPEGMDRTDWEGELAAVIGRPARNLSVEQALSCVAGYTIVHDVSIRGGSRRGANGDRPDFLAGKGRATFKPMGPAIIPAGFVPDPQSLRIQTWVSDKLKQDSSTAQMIFTTAELISWLSHLSGLAPGDVIATGTPAGVGMPRGEFLRPGDTVTIAIEGVGQLSNPVTAG